jgi:hypothetical protein
MKIEIPLSIGRRESDKWFAAIMQKTIHRQARSVRPILSGPLDTQIHGQVERTNSGRRPRRSRAQLEQALERAFQLVRAQKPKWSAKRSWKRARNLVRLYQVV